MTNTDTTAMPLFYGHEDAAYNLKPPEQDHSSSQYTGGALFQEKGDPIYIIDESVPDNSLRFHEFRIKHDDGQALLSFAAGASDEAGRAKQPDRTLTLELVSDADGGDPHDTDDDSNDTLEERLFKTPHVLFADWGNKRVFRQPYHTTTYEGINKAASLLHKQLTQLYSQATSESAFEEDAVVMDLYLKQERALFYRLASAMWSEEQSEPDKLTAVKGAASVWQAYMLWSCNAKLKRLSESQDTTNEVAE